MQFVEFRSVQDTTLALTLLQGITLSGRELKIVRPPEYTELSNVYHSYVAPVGLTENDLLEKKKAELEKAKKSGKTTVKSRVLLFDEMATDADLKDEEEFADIIMDIGEECENAGGGDVLDVVVLKSGVRKGSAFVLFDSPDAAEKAKSILHGKRFNGRDVKVSFFFESNFSRGEFE